MTEKHQTQVNLLVRHMGAVARGDHKAAEAIEAEAKKKGFHMEAVQQSSEKKV